MHPFDVRHKRKQKLQSQVIGPEYLLLGSEPTARDYLPGSQLALRYRNRYLAKRRVMRTIRRLKHDQNKA